MRRLLDTLYLTAGGIAAFAILLICLLVTAQVGLNVLARIGGPAWSYTIPSYADFAGYFLSTASFMAFAYTLRQGGHIRVNLFVGRMSARIRWKLEMMTLAVAGAASAFAFCYGTKLMLESLHYGDKSTGMIAVPIWIPQCAMVAGLALLTLAFFDTLVQSLRAGQSVIVDQEEA
ncbi:TRAP transporter small permease [Pseudooceanicola sp. C21-150M6]|uniref:TRAP transporter small permease n=1 Tax=Pseudooceanicola sp. C21-150M6 TaxID=3434355 RepID=UPI003D800177